MRFGDLYCCFGILLRSTHCSNASWHQGRAQQSYQSLQGLFHWFLISFSARSSLVIEFNLPWNDKQAATYGDSFRAWADADFQAAIAAVNGACPYNQLAIVVFLICHF